MDEAWTPLKVLEWTTSRFDRAGIDSARLDAQVLLAHALGCDRVSLYTSFDKPLAPEELSAYRELVKRRLAGEPVAYLVGEQEFWSLPVRVDPRVLIPRRDSETLVEVALGALRGRGVPLSIADVATGSGAIALALASELPEARVVATDASEDALALARENVARHQLGERIELRAGDLLAPLAGERHDALVANLPYVPSGDLEGLAPEVRREPRSALDGGPDGLDVLRRFLSGAAAHLTPGGMVAVEHGFDQAEAVRELGEAAGLGAGQTRRDLGDRDRVTWFRRES